MRLDRFSQGNYTVGRSFLAQLVWYFVGQPLLSTRLVPVSAFKRSILRLFGAKIGTGVVVKPGVRVKFPWRLSVGDYSWIGEDVWIDNLAYVTIGRHVCVSQAAYLCTGSHDRKSPAFDLKTYPITIEDHAWIGARCVLGPKSVVHTGAVITLGSVVSGELTSWSIYAGNPAVFTASRPDTSSTPKPRVLFVNQSFWPDCSASSQFLTDAAVYIADRGNEVHVVTTKSGYVSSDEYQTEETYRGVHIHRSSYSKTPSSRNKFGRILKSIVNNLALTLAVARAPRVEVMIALTSPPLLSVFLRFVAKVRGFRFVAWIFDLNPDQAVAAGWLSRESFVFAMLNRMVADCCEASSAVIVLDDYMADRIKQKRVSNPHVYTLPLWVSSDEITPIAHEDNTFRRDAFEAEVFIVLFAGNLSLCHPIETILLAAKELRCDDSIRFVFSGGGPRMQEVSSFISLYQLPNVRIMPYRSRDQLPEILASGDLHLIPMGDEFVGILHPSKVYGIVASGRPFVFIGPERSFIVDQFVKKGIGSHVNHGQIDELVEVIQRERTRCQESRFVFRQASRDAAKKFERAEVLASFCRTLDL